MLHLWQHKVLEKHMQDQRWMLLVRVVSDLLQLRSWQCSNQPRQCSSLTSVSRTRPAKLSRAGQTLPQPQARILPRGFVIHNCRTYRAQFSEFTCMTSLHAASFLSYCFQMKTKQEYKTPSSCCNLFIYFGLFHFILLLTPCYYLLSPNEWCRCDCIQFLSTNKKSLLVCTVFSEQLWAPMHNWVWVRLVGADWWLGQVPLGKQVGL